jgi:hypothetical protein
LGSAGGTDAYTLAGEETAAGDPQTCIVRIRLKSISSRPRLFSANGFFG